MATDPIKAIGFGSTGKVEQLKPLKPLGEGKAIGFDRVTPTTPDPMEGTTPSEQYTEGYIPGTSLQDRLAENQNGWDQFGNFLAQTGIEALAGTVEAGSYLLDFQQHLDKIKGEEMEYSNWLADQAKQLKEEARTEWAPVYLSEENQGFQPASAEWWAANGGQGLGSTLSLLIPGTIAAKVGKLVGLGGIGQTISATVASRYAESTMEANQVYQEAIANGASKEQAGDAASKVWNTNWLFAIQDFTQFAAISKGFNSLSKGVKGSGFGQLLKSMTSEGLEEAGQYVVSEEAKRTAQDANIDYFGEGFSKRLADYVDDDEFATSTLLGAVGGGVFQAVGSVADKLLDTKQGSILPNIKDRMQKLIGRGVQKELANAIDDKVTSQAITNVDFGQQFIDNFNRGRLPEYRAELEEQKKTPNLPTEAKKSIDDHIQNIDDLMTEEAKLRNSSIPQDLHKPILLLKLQINQNSGLNKQADNELREVYQKAADQGLDPMLSDLKKLQANAFAYTELAKSNPQFSTKAKTAMDAFNNQADMTSFATPGLDVDKALVTDFDDKINQLTLQSVSTKEKRDQLKKDLDGLTTPAGIAAHRNKEAQKTLDKASLAILNDPNSTKEQLLQAEANTKDPQIKIELAKRFQQLIDKDKQANIEELQTVMDENQSEPDVDLPEDISPDLVQEPEILPPDFDPNLESVPDDFDFEEEPPIEEPGTSPAKSKWGLTAKETGDLINKVDVETRQPKPVINQQKESEEGARESVRNKTSVSTTALNLNSANNPIVYHNNITGETVRPEQIFAVDNTTGQLLINTPRISAGQKVILKVENDFPWTQQAGFKPNSKDNYTINVYIEGVQRPLTQLRNADNKYLKTEEKEVNSKLRDLVLSKGSLETTITSKNVGTPRTDNTLKTIEILESDFMIQADGRWAMQVLPHSPIFGLIDHNGVIHTPNIGSMKDINRNPGIEGRVEDAKEKYITATDLKKLAGKTIVFRTAPDGTLRAIGQEYRNLTQEEIGWVRNNISNLINNQNFQTLKEVIHIPQHPSGVYKHTDDKGRPKTPDVVKLDRQRFHIVSTSKSTEDFLIPVLGKDNKRLWISVQNDQLENLLNNRSFQYRIIDGAGNKSPARTDGGERIVEAFNKILNKQFKNVNEANLNSEIQYTDPVTQQVYPTFYDYLVKTQTVQTNLKGSLTLSSGEDSSYSFNQVSLYLDPNPSDVKVEISPEEEVITIEDTSTIESSKDKEKAPEDLKKLIEELYESEDTHLKPYESNGYTFELIGERELNWFRDHIGENYLVIAKNVDKFVARNGVEAFGQYYNSLVTVADFAPAGTVYHEAFHFLFDPKNGLVTKREKEELLKQYGSEEKLAEEWEKYKLSEGQYKPKSVKAKSFFRRLLQMIRSLLGFKSPIERLFRGFDVVVPGDVVTNPNLEDLSEPQFKLLPGFVKAAQQREAVQAFASEVMRYTNEIIREENIDILDFFTDQENIDKVFDLVKSRFTKDYDRIASTPVNERTKNDMGRYLSYLAMGIGKSSTISESMFNGEYEDVKREGLSPQEGFKTKVLKDLGRWGFRVKMSDKTIYEVPQTDDDQTEKQELKANDESERLYNIDSTQINPTDSLSQRIRLFLSTIPEPITDVNGRPTTANKTTIFGTVKYIDFKRVDATLTLQLSNAINPLSRLEELSNSHPIAKVVLNRLMDEKNKGNNQVYTEFFVKYRRDGYTKKSVLLEKEKKWLKPEDRDPGGPDHIIIHRSKLIDTDRNSVDRVLLNKWREEGIRKKTIETDGTTIQNKATSLLKEFKLFKDNFNDAKNKKINLPYQNVRDKFDVILKALGVDIPVQLWDELDTLKPSEKYAQLQDWMFGVRKHSLEDLLIKYNDGADPFSGSNIISDLAERVVIYVENLSRGAYLNESGDQEYPNNTPSYITEFINNALQYPEEIVSRYEQDKFYNGNAFLGVIKDKASRSNLELEFTSSIREGDKDPKDFQSRSEIESLIMRFTAFHNNASDTAFINVGTPSDKTKQPMLALPKYKGTRAKDFLMTVLNRNIDSESVRIQRLKSFTERANNQPLPTDIKNLKNNAKFIYVPELNTIPNLSVEVSSGSISTQEYTQARQSAQGILNKFITDEYELFLKYLEENDLIKTKRSKENILEVESATTKMPEGILYDHKGFRVHTPEAFLKEFFYNDLAWRFEVSKVFQGDLALYTNQDDYFKRQYQLVTPGYRPLTETKTIITRGVYGKQFKVNNEEYLMSLVKLIKPTATKSDSIYKDVLSKYETVNKTDAQSLMTIDAYKAIAESLGQWTKDHDMIYNFAWRHGLPIRRAISDALKAGVMTEEQATTYRVVAGKILLQPFKPFVFRDLPITLPDGNIMMIKEQVKDSITVITPEMSTVSKGYTDLLAYMYANEIDIMSAEDTVKVGSYGVINDFSIPPAQWQKRVTKIEDFKFPQFIPDKKKEEVSGTQTHKLILGNINPETKYQIGKKERTGKQVVADYNDYWSEKLEQSSEDLKKRLGLTKDGLILSDDPKKRSDQLFKLHLLLKQELGEREINDNYWDTLDLVKKGAEQVDFTLPISFPAFGPKFQAILTNLWKKEVIKQKSPGYSAVNLADFGVGYSDELKFVQNDNGEITEAEIGLPIDYVNDIGLKYGEHILPNGTILWDKLNNNQQEALQFILYRIPTSNKSSMLPVRVVRITPPQLNNIVMIPGELTIQQGLDFDVDKSQLIRRVLTEGKVDEKNVDTKLFNLYWGILTNKDHILELLTPLASPTMEAKLAEFREKGIIQSVERSSPLSTTADVQAEVRNKDGQAEIGIASRFNTGHTVLQTIKDYVAVKGGINITHKSDYVFDQLGRKDDADGALISTNHAESQQAALDAAKNPLLAYFNVVKGTMAAFHTMLEFGVPLPVAIDFFMQPVIKEWTRFYKHEGQSVSRATEKLFDNYPGIRSQYDLLKEGKEKVDLTSKALSNNLNKTVNDSFAHSARVLVEFENIVIISNQLSNINNVISVDTFQDATGLEALQSFLEQRDVATDQNADIYIDARVFDLETAPAEARRLASFFKYGIQDAVEYISQFYPSASTQYIQMRDYYAQVTGEEAITDKKLIKKLNQFTDYFLMQYDSKLFKVMNMAHPLYNEDPKLDKSDYRLRWSFFDPNRSIWKYINSVVDAKDKDGKLLYPALQRNDLLKNLESEESRQNQVQIIGVRNTDAQTDKTDYINAWWDLLDHTSPEVRTLGHDLIRYAVQTSAFQYSTRSFYDLIPVQYLVQYGIGDMWDGISKNPTIDNESAIVNFIRHNFRSLDRFPQIYVQDVAGQFKSDVILDVKQTNDHLKGFTLKSTYKADPPRFIRVEDKKMGDYRLYESSQAEPRVFREVQPLGGKNFVEVSADRMPSNHSGVRVNYKDVSPDPWKSVNFKLEGFVDGTSPYLSKYLPEDTNNAQTVIENLLKFEVDVEARKGLEVLLRNVSKINTPIEKMSPLIRLAMPKAAAAFRVTTNESGLVNTVISINPRANIESEAQMRHTIQHELHHAYGVGVIQNPTGENQVNFVRNINRVYQDSLKRADIKGQYALTNVYEFHAELASNPEFRRKLRKTDLWSRILRAFRKLLGMTDQYDKLLDQYYTVLDKAEELQKIDPGAFALIQEEKKIEGSKRITIFQKMLASMKARESDLRKRWRRTEASALVKERELLERLVKTNRNKAVSQYLFTTSRDLNQLKETYDLLSKDPKKINPQTLNSMRQQLISYNEIVPRLVDNIYEVPSDYIPADTDQNKFLEEANKLSSEISRLLKKVEKLGIKRFAQVIKDSLNDPNLTVEQIEDNLTVADRDIVWSSRWLDPGFDIEDPAIKTIAKKLKDNASEAYRNIQQDLYTTETTEKEALVVGLKPTSTGIGMYWDKRRIKYKSTGLFKALNDYEQWLKLPGNKPKSDNFTDKFSRVIDPTSKGENDDGVHLISPFSKEGREILSIKEDSKDYPLKQFYSSFVLEYLRSQEKIAQYSMRPGLRIPSISRGLMEGFLREKGIKNTANLFTEQFLNNFRERFDELDFQPVNQSLEPRQEVPIRFISKQDGRDGRLTTREVSIDIANTIPMFIHEMYSRAGLLELQDDLEIGQALLASRKVLRTRKVSGKGISPLLNRATENIPLATGEYASITGKESKSFEAYNSLMRRFLYGQYKKREGDIKLGGMKASVAKGFDWLLRMTGMKLMLFNVAIPLTNYVGTEVNFIKEVVGGNIINRKNWLAGQKVFGDAGLAAIQDLSRREKKTRMGRIFTYFNPMDTERPVSNLGVDSNWMRTILHKITNSGSELLEYKLAWTAFGAVLDRFKVVNPEGKEVSMLKGLEVSTDGKVTLAKGYTYNGKNSLDSETIDQVIQYTLRVYQSATGVRNKMDSPTANEFVVGRAVTFMRNWLKAGVNTRYKTKHFDEKLMKENEGHYISSFILFNNMFGKQGFVKSMSDTLKVMLFMNNEDPELLLLPEELTLSQERQQEIINLRQANIRKTTFELYMITALSALIWFGWDEDDDDSYLRYMSARIRRELMTFINPVTAWEVLRSPTVALSTVDGFQKIFSSTLDTIGATIIGDEQPIYQKGPYKDQHKLFADIERQFFPFRKQFKDMDQRTNLILKGGIR